MSVVYTICVNILNACDVSSVLFVVGLQLIEFPNHKQPMNPNRENSSHMIPTLQVSCLFNMEDRLLI